MCEAGTEARNLRLFFYYFIRLFLIIILLIYYNNIYEACLSVGVIYLSETPTPGVRRADLSGCDKTVTNMMLVNKHTFGEAVICRD